MKIVTKNNHLVLTLEAQNYYEKLVESKMLAGLSRELAEDGARKQIESDAGLITPAFDPNQDHEEAIATAGVNTNARQLASNSNASELPPVEVHFVKGKFTRAVKKSDAVRKPAKD